MAKLADLFYAFISHKIHIRIYGMEGQILAMQTCLKDIRIEIE
jgi:hypothetical protein